MIRFIQNLTIEFVIWKHWNLNEWSIELNKIKDSFGKWWFVYTTRRIKLKLLKGSSMIMLISRQSYPNYETSNWFRLLHSIQPHQTKNFIQFPFSCFIQNENNIHCKNPFSLNMSMMMVHLSTTILGGVEDSVPSWVPRMSSALYSKR